MSGAKVTINSSKGQSTLARAKFGPGMLLHHDDLEQLNTYTRELSRLLFRSFFGCGVICGLVVRTEPKCGKVHVIVEPGLALDCSGDPVYVPKEHRLALDEECDQTLPPQLWVVLCGTTKCCAPRTSMCASDEDEAPSVCTRERDGFEIRIVREMPRCACGCTKVATDPLLREMDCKCVDPNDLCYFDHYDGKCGCDCGDGSDCDCECIILARLDKIEDTQQPWSVDHRVRRFIRPVLMRDPQVEKEVNAKGETPNAAALHQEEQPVPAAKASQRKRS